MLAYHSDDLAYGFSGGGELVSWGVRVRVAQGYCHCELELFRDVQELSYHGFYQSGEAYDTASEAVAVGA